MFVKPGRENGEFSVRSCFKLLDKDDPIIISWKNIWFHLIPSKVQYFACMANQKERFNNRLFGEKRPLSPKYMPSLQ